MIRVGTASWSDPEFVRDWYPRGLSARERLPYYAEHFDLVEVNSTFYAIPEPAVVGKWARITPPGFLFDVKLHKLFSRHRCQPRHLPKELREVDLRANGTVILTPEIEHDALELFLAAMEPLEAVGKLGTLLLQLTPGFSPRTSRLTDLDGLFHQLRGRSVVVELRNRNWMAGEQASETTRYFADRGVTLVSVDAPSEPHFTIMPSVDSVTNPALGYLRLHGRNARAYTTGKTVATRFDYNYSDEELEGIKARVEAIGRHTRDVHVLFNNNHGNYAPTNARRLREILGQVAPLPKETLF